MTEPSQQIPTAVIGAIRQLLAPLARLMIRHGITMPAIIEVLKQVLVSVAEKDFPVAGKSTTDSRVSVLTGVHRKDVKRLRRETPAERDVPKTVSVGAQVVNIDQNEFTGSKSILITETVGEPVTRIGENSFEETPEPQVESIAGK